MRGDQYNHMYLYMESKKKGHALCGDMTLGKNTWEEKMTKTYRGNFFLLRREWENSAGVEVNEAKNVLKRNVTVLCLFKIACYMNNTFPNFIKFSRLWNYFIDY